MKKYLNKFKIYWSKVPDWLQDSLSFITSISAFIGLIYGAAKVIYKALLQITGNTLPIDFPWIICILLLIVIVFMRSKIKQYKKSLWTRLENDAGSYYSVLHDFRNFYFDILTNHKNKKLSPAFLTSITQNFLVNMLDKLCNIYAAYTGSTINTCIKLIGKENEEINFDEIDMDNATVYTYARSSNISKMREDASNDKPVLVKENTDFAYIIKPPSFYKKQYFYEQDLHLFNEALKKHMEEYKNTNTDYWTFYRAAIVVPIRIAHTHLYFTQKTDPKDYHIVGFLCIDTMSTEAFIPEYEEQFIQIAKSFSALIYVVMNKYGFYLKKSKNGYKRPRKKTMKKEEISTNDTENKSDL